MNLLNPIFTEKRECQDCYKCLRNCPVKAIKVESGYASVVPEMCILCGHCVAICPNGAKKVRDDLPRARQLLAGGKRVYASLAPSFVSEFPNIAPAKIIAALKALGFAGVSETALGAQEVSAHTSAMIARADGQVLLSSACPTVVAFIQKHHPDQSDRITPLLSPLLTHCRMLRQSFGEDIGIVFIGPCIAKKLEADRHPELLDVALTFEDLDRWLQQERIDPAALPDSPDHAFVPRASTDGAWYPVDGGMIAGVKSHCTITDAAFMNFSGLSAIHKALEGLGDLPKDQCCFMELLACEGGCVNGPKVTTPPATAAKRARVLRYGRHPEEPLPRRPQINISETFAVAHLPAIPLPDAQIRDALRSVGKITADHELNCGGCGYDTCRQFAAALVSQKAERSMCVTYMRQLAHKKASALVHKMPSAVVIVSDQMQVLECNAAFARLFAKEDRPAEELASAMENQPVASLLPFHSMFSAVLRTGQDIHDKDLRFRDKVLHLSIFTIEPHLVVGAIIQDVTKPLVQKEQIIKKAQDVIRRNLSTVQQIAYLLGENASESEITLNSIIDSFTPPKIDEAASPESTDWRKLYKKP